MRDAIGGVVNIQMILVFIAIVSGYLAFSVSYTKAVHVKDFIINKIEEYEGYGEINGSGVSTAGKSAIIKNEINKYMNKIGYSGTGVPHNVDCSQVIESTTGASGVGATLVSDSDTSKDYAVCRYEGSKGIRYNEETKTISEKDVNRYYYVVVTFISIDVPVINQIMSNLQFFEITGKTKLIEDLSI